MALQLIRRLREHARIRPHAEALRQVDPTGGGDRVLTYVELCTAVDMLASRIRRELPPDPVILICYPNQLECVVAFYAGLSAGATVFPVHPQSSDVELLEAAGRSRAAAIMGTDRASKLLQTAGLNVVECSTLDTRAAGCSPLREASRVSPRDSTTAIDLQRSDTARLLLQSSGTTGTPKIVERSGPSLNAVARNIVGSIDLSPDDRLLALIPLCHSYGVEHGMLAPIFAGCCVHLCQKLDADTILNQLSHGGITVFPGVPSMFEMLAQLGGNTHPLPSLRCAYSAGSILPRKVFEAFRQRFGVNIGQVFGMTEIGTVTFNDPRTEQHDPLSVGVPMEGVRVRVVDPYAPRLDVPLPPGEEGEVAISAPSMLTGYLGNGELASNSEGPETMRDGYFFTGDLGRLDERGRLTITGRLKLIVDIGGLKVNLLEVEEALRAHPKVKDCAVIAVPVSETVSRLKAVIVRRDAGADLSFNELRRHLRARLSAHKIPRLFEIRDSLPRSATGKILRHAL